MRIATIYRSIDSDGYCGQEHGLYKTADEARKASSYGDTPVERKALITDNGFVWLLDRDGPFRFTFDVEEKRRAALAKLTDEEIELLGIKE